jgi:predicted Fe-Mo cluster-binding NifX family protein
MKRVAIPVVSGKLSEFFAQCNHYEIFEIDGTDIKKGEIKVPSGKEISTLLSWVSGQGITDVITYKVDRRIMELFATYKINLYVGIKMGPPREIIQDYLNGTLKSDKKIISEIMTQYE